MDFEDELLGFNVVVIHMVLPSMLCTIISAFFRQSINIELLLCSLGLPLVDPVCCRHPLSHSLNDIM